MLAAVYASWSSCHLAGALRKEQHAFVCAADAKNIDTTRRRPYIYLDMRWIGASVWTNHTCIWCLLQVVQAAAAATQQLLLVQPPAGVPFVPLLLWRLRRVTRQQGLDAAR
jgi:hypothetical protein